MYVPHHQTPNPHENGVDGLQARGRANIIKGVIHEPTFFACVSFRQSYTSKTKGSAVDAEMFWRVVLCVVYWGLAFDFILIFSYPLILSSYLELNQVLQPYLLGR